MSGHPILVDGPQPADLLDTVLAKLPTTAHTRFRSAIVPALWHVALELGIDFPGMVAQSAIETGWGNFTGKAQWWFYNTGGMKVRHAEQVMDLLGTQDVNHPLVHQQQPSWEVGALAHGQQLVYGYCKRPVPAGTLIVSSRLHLVPDPAVSTWEELSGRWAVPGEGYGEHIVDLRGRLT